MPEFKYTARDISGKEMNGKRNALSAEDLAMQLQNESLTPLDISLASKKSNKAKSSWMKRDVFKAKVSQDELQMLCRQMYTVLKAGIPIAIAIALAAGSTGTCLITNTSLGQTANAVVHSTS